MLAINFRETSRNCMKMSLKITASVVLLGLLAMPARGQERAATDMTSLVNGYERAAHSSFVGVPTDWSTGHVVFSPPAPGSDAEDKVQQDPRYWLQQIRHAQLQSDGSFATDDGVGAVPDKKKKKKTKLVKIKKVKVEKDWSQSLGGTGASVGPNFFPAKFSYGTTAASCTDYAAFNTSLAGSATQASIISFTNIYTGCGGTVPTIAWAFNTGGTASTSITPSFDGTQEAFVESVGTTATLVLLKWNAGPAANHAVTLTLTTGSTAVVATAGTFSAADVGAQITATGIPAGDTIAAFTNSTHATLATAATASGSHAATVHAETAVLPGVAPTVANGSYRACTAPCMTTFAFNGTPNDTNSSPYYVFSGPDADAIFVGDSTGKLHKFTGVFNGTPAEVTTGGFPITTAIEALSGAIYNQVSGTVVVDASYDGTNNGARLHEITVDAATPAVTDSTILGPTTAGGTNCAGTTLGATTSALLVDAPVIDPTAGTAGETYVFIANDGETTPDSAVYQFASGFAEHTCGNKAVIGTGSTTGVPVYSGAFDAIYLKSADPPSGNIYVCGNAGGDPTLYRIPIASNAFGTVSTGPVLTTAATTCSPVTEFENGATDRAYLSVRASGKTAAPISCPTNAGCLMSFTLGTTLPVTTPAGTTAAVTENGGTSGIVIDNSSTTPTGASQIYFSTLGGATAIQASQAALN